MTEIVIATANRHKLRELAALLGGKTVKWRSLAEFKGLPAVKESGRSFEANAKKKALAAARATGLLALADDSGIEVDALGGAPGIRSARYAGAHGDDVANNRKLLRELRNVPSARRTARYRCILALASPKKVLALADGVWEGQIAIESRGKEGFGYDPLFLLPRYRKTAGELSPKLKERLSHRAAAARKLRPALKRLLALQRVEKVLDRAAA